MPALPAPPEAVRRLFESGQGHFKSSQARLTSRQRLQDPRRGHRQGVHADADSVVDGVSNDSPHHRDGRLAASLRGHARIVDEHDFDLRPPGEARDFVGVEILIEDAAVLEPDLLGQTITEAHGDTALDLHPDALGIDDLARILGANDAQDADRTLLLVDLNFGHRGHVGAQIIRDGDAVAAPAWRLGERPAEFVGGRPDYLLHAGVGQVLDPEFEGVHSRRLGQDVDMGFCGEDIGVAAGPAPGARAEGVDGDSAGAPAAEGENTLVGGIVDRLGASATSVVVLVVPENDPEMKAALVSPLSGAAFLLLR